MATRRYGISRGEEQIFVTETVGAATNADNVELTFDLAVGLEKGEVIRLVSKITDHIIGDDFPPA